MTELASDGQRKSRNRLRILRRLFTACQVQFDVVQLTRVSVMSQTATELLDAAMALPGEHRLKLAEALLASLDPALRPPLDEAWRAIIRRRSEELRSGQVAGIPWEEVKRNARN